MCLVCKMGTLSEEVEKYMSPVFRDYYANSSVFIAAALAIILLAGLLVLIPIGIAEARRERQRRLAGAKRKPPLHGAVRRCV